MREFFESFSSWIFYNDNYHYIILQSTGTYIFTTLKRDVRHETSKTTIDFLQIVYLKKLVKYAFKLYNWLGR